MNRIAPQWIVEDLQETLDFYTKELGFHIDWQGSLFAIISLGTVSIMLRQLKTPDKKRPNWIPFIEAGWHTDGQEAWDAYIWMDDIDQFYKELSQRQVRILKELGETDYGNRDFEIEDNNGYILCFGSKPS